MAIKKNQPGDKIDHYEPVSDGTHVSSDGQHTIQVDTHPELPGHVQVRHTIKPANDVPYMHSWAASAGDFQLPPLPEGITWQRGQRGVQNLPVNGNMRDKHPAASQLGQGVTPQKIEDPAQWAALYHKMTGNAIPGLPEGGTAPDGYAKDVSHVPQMVRDAYKAGKTVQAPDGSPMHLHDYVRSHTGMDENPFSILHAHEVMRQEAAEASGNPDSYKPSLHHAVMHHLLTLQNHIDRAPNKNGLPDIKIGKLSEFNRTVNEMVHSYITDPKNANEAITQRAKAAGIDPNTLNSPAHIDFDGITAGYEDSVGVAKNLLTNHFAKKGFPGLHKFKDEHWGQIPPHTEDNGWKPPEQYGLKNSLNEVPNHGIKWDENARGPVDHAYRSLYNTHFRGGEQVDEIYGKNEDGSPIIGKKGWQQALSDAHAKGGAALYALKQNRLAPPFKHHLGILNEAMNEGGAKGHHREAIERHKAMMEMLHGHEGSQFTAPAAAPTHGSQPTEMFNQQHSAPAGPERKLNVPAVQMLYGRIDDKHDGHMIPNDKYPVIHMPEFHPEDVKHIQHLAQVHHASRLLHKKHEEMAATQPQFASRAKADSIRIKDIEGRLKSHAAKIGMTDNHVGQIQQHVAKLADANAGMKGHAPAKFTKVPRMEE